MRIKIAVIQYSKIKSESPRAFSSFVQDEEILQLLVGDTQHIGKSTQFNTRTYSLSATTSVIIYDQIVLSEVAVQEMLT